MNRRLLAIVAASFVACLPVSAPAAQPSELVDVPFLAERVASGDLPPLAERLPEVPSVITFDEDDRELGQHGGELRMLMAKTNDIRMMTVYGYARLVGYDRNLNLRPDILEDITVDERRIFTMRLRKGHRWSDGHPFTAEDFRYYWEDVVNNEDLSPFGPPQVLEIDGEPPTVEFLGEHTVRYTWSQPNPHFLPALAGASPLFIYRPAHYLKQFHINHGDPEALKALVRRSGTRNWAGLHHRMDHQYKADNPNLPVLQPWRQTTSPPSERFIFERNPYYHRLDEEGRQLPYIDRVIMNIADKQLIPAKTGSGEVDLQGRYLRFDNYTFLKESEKRNAYSVRLWRTAKGSQVALYPNLNAKDPVWASVLRDVRFRRALSLAIDRSEINQVIYYGLVNEGNNTVLPESAVYKTEFETLWAETNIDKANALLDEIGLTERSPQGLRKLPDGRTLEVIVESAGESTEETDVLELVRDSWEEIGVKLFTKPSQREIFRNRIFSGDTTMSVWSGLDNAIPTASMSPHELAPTQQVQLQWPKWGQYFESGGEVGETPDMPEVKQLLALNDEWVHSNDDGERTEIWHQMLRIYAQQQFTIGTVRGVMQPVVVSNRLRNVPAEGVYNWDPGAYFGRYDMDAFWFADAQ